MNSLEEPVVQEVSKPAPTNKRKNAAGAANSEPVPVPMKRPSAAARMVGEENKEMGTPMKRPSGAAASAPAQEEDDNDADDLDEVDEVDETPVMKRPSALRKPSEKISKVDTKKKPQTKDKNEKKPGKARSIEVTCLRGIKVATTGN